MAHHTHKISSQTTLALAFIFGFASLAFAQSQPSPDDIANRGYSQYKDIPETKKGTVIFSEPSSAQQKSCAPAVKSAHCKKKPAKVCAKGKAPAKKKADSESEDLNQLQQQARLYRAQGIEMQNAGNLSAAVNLFQKAIQLDPFYAASFNDLGVVYEAYGDPKRAEQTYLQAIQIDPDYLAAYTNLALLYENQRDLADAAKCWKKRAMLGVPGEPWTEKARRRYCDIQDVLSDSPVGGRKKEQELFRVVSDVSAEKEVLKKDDKALANNYLEKAKFNYFQKNDEVTALKILIDAKQLDPNNSEILDLIDQIETRLLSK